MACHQFWDRIRSVYLCNFRKDIVIEYEEDGELFSLGEDPMELRSMNLRITKFHLSFCERNDTEGDQKHLADIPTEYKCKQA